MATGLSAGPPPAELQAGSGTSAVSGGETPGSGRARCVAEAGPGGGVLSAGRSRRTARPARLQASSSARPAAESRGAVPVSHDGSPERGATRIQRIASPSRGSPRAGETPIPEWRPRARAASAVVARWVGAGDRTSGTRAAPPESRRLGAALEVGVLHRDLAGAELEQVQAAHLDRGPVRERPGHGPLRDAAVAEHRVADRVELHATHGPQHVLEPRAHLRLADVG